MAGIHPRLHLRRIKLPRHHGRGLPHVARPKCPQASERQSGPALLIGLTWIPIGLAADITTFWILGTGFMLAGLANRDKWDS